MIGPAPSPRPSLLSRHGSGSNAEILPADPVFAGGLAECGRAESAIPLLSFP